jgi:hypothetical protein
MPYAFRTLLLILLVISGPAMRTQVDGQAAHPDAVSEAAKAREDAKKRNSNASPVGSNSPTGVNREPSLKPKTSSAAAGNHASVKPKGGLETKGLETKATPHYNMPGSKKTPPSATKDAEDKHHTDEKLDLEPYDLGCADPKLSEAQKKKCRERKH